MNPDSPSSSSTPGGYSMIRELPAGTPSAMPRESLAASLQTLTPRIRIPSAGLVTDGTGTYTLYQVEVELIGHTWALAKRYSDFDELHRHLRSCYKNVLSEERWPPFPEKTWLGRFDSSTVETRRLQLEVHTLGPGPVMTRMLLWLLLAHRSRRWRVIRRTTCSRR